MEDFILFLFCLMTVKFKYVCHGNYRSVDITRTLIYISH